MQGFDWDADKNSSNLEKHGIAFETAAKIFDGPTVEFEDRRRDYREARVIAFGEAEGRILGVVYVRRGDRIRIISARRASRREREFYHEKITPE